MAKRKIFKVDNQRFNDYTEVDVSKIKFFVENDNTPSSETITSLTLNGNFLEYIDESGTTVSIDLSPYLDNTNLSRITGGTFDASTKELILSRDDNSEIKIDATGVFDDTNLVTSVNGEVGDITIPVVQNTSDLINNGEGTDPFITDKDVITYDSARVVINTTFLGPGSGYSIDTLDISYTPTNAFEIYGSGGNTALVDSYDLNIPTNVFFIVKKPTNLDLENARLGIVEGQQRIDLGIPEFDNTNFIAWNITTLMTDKSLTSGNDYEFTFWKAVAGSGGSGVGVQSTDNNGDGTFTINYTDGSSFTSSDLTGPQGPIGPQGPQGQVGADGNGIASTTDNLDGTFTFNYTDGSTFTTSDLTGPAGTGTGTDSYVSNVQVSGTTLQFTGVGSATSQAVTLPTTTSVSNEVDTIADLRALTPPANGTIYKVKAHNSKGLNQELGGGYFRYTNVPVLDVAATFNGVWRQTIGIKKGDKEWTQAYTVSFDYKNLTKNIYQSESYGTNLVRIDPIDPSNNMTITFRSSDGNEQKQATYLGAVNGLGESNTTPETAHSFGNVRVYPIHNNELANSELPDFSYTTFGTNPLDDIAVDWSFYMADDNGCFINPNNEVGYWERIMPDDKAVTPEMYGAIPYSHPNEVLGIIETDRNDSTQAIQNAFDNIYYDFKAHGGAYYIADTLITRRNKRYEFSFGGFNKVGDGGRSTWKHNSAIVFSDKNINIIEDGGCNLDNCVFNIDTSTATEQTSNAFTVDIRNYVWHRLRDCEINIRGNEKILSDSENSGMNGFVLDNRPRLDWKGEIFDGTLDTKLVGDGTQTYDDVYGPGVDYGSFESPSRISMKKGIGVYQNCSVKLRIYGVNKGIWCTDIPDVIDPYSPSNESSSDAWVRSSSINTSNFKIIEAVGFKQLVVLDRGIGSSRFENQVVQFTYNLSYQQALTLPAVKLMGSGVFFDGFFMDASLIKLSEQDMFIELEDLSTETGVEPRDKVLNYINGLPVGDAITIRESPNKAPENIMRATIDGVNYSFKLRFVSTGDFSSANPIPDANKIIPLENENVFSNFYLMDIRDKGVTLGPALKASLGKDIAHNRFLNSENLQDNQVGSALTNASFVAPRNGVVSSEPLKISRLLNAMSFIDRSSSFDFEVGAYQYNNTTNPNLSLEDYIGIGHLEAPTTDSPITDQGSITIDNPFSMINPDESQSKATFGAGSNTDTDYIEVYWRGQLTCQDLYVSFGNVPKKVQLITGSFDGTGTTINDIQTINNFDIYDLTNVKPNVTVTFKDYESTGSTQFGCLRFIGAKPNEQGNYEVKVNDIFAIPKVGGSARYPYIHRGGGQTIHGTLGATEGLIVTSPDGLVTKTIGIDNSGNISVT